MALTHEDRAEFELEWNSESRGRLFISQNDVEVVVYVNRESIDRLKEALGYEV